MRNYYFKTTIALALAYGGAIAPLYAQLNGTYSVNAGAPASAGNYQNLRSAVSDMMSGTRLDGGPINGPAVSGPVTIRLVGGSGPYTEQVSIGAIPGASPTRSIRITGGPSRETVQTSTTTTGDRHVIRLSGTRHVTLDSLTLLNTGATYGYGIWLTGGADSNYVSNNIVTVNNSSTSTNFAGITISGATVASNGDFGDDNTISGNTVTGGYYGLSCRGTSTTVFSQRNKWINNVVTDYYLYGLYNYQQNLTEIFGNRLTARATASTGNYGMYLYYNDRFKCERNVISNNLGTIGIYAFTPNYQGGAATSRASIINNMIGGTCLGTTTYGISLATNVTNLDVQHNSVWLTSGNGRGLNVTTGSGNTFLNNSLVVTGSTTGYAFYASAVATISSLNYNNYYAPGSSNFIFIASAYTPANFVGGGGYNLNSVTGDPAYVSPSNLHMTSGLLCYNSGTPGAASIDIDGQPRPANGAYDIGADEFSLPTDDVGPEALASPLAPFASGTQPVNLILRNHGVSTLDSARITWTLDGGAPTIYNFIGSVPSASNSAPIFLGNANFTPGPHTLQFITSLPNGNPDVNALNDTLTLTVCTGLSGTYTIGGVGADFPTINAAVDALTCGGALGPVTMRLNASAAPFVEQVIIPVIPGASLTRPVRFTGGPTRAAVTFTGTTTSQRATIKLDGARSIILDSLTISNTDATYGYGVQITNSADSNTVSNCIVNLSTTTTSSNFAGITLSGATVTTNGDNGDENLIIGNEVHGGYYGITARGISTTLFNQRNHIRNNVVEDCYYYGIYLYAQNGNEITENRISLRTPGTTASYGIYLGYIDAFACSRNFIQNAGTYGIYGLYANYNFGAAGPRASIVNNMIGGGFRATSSYGIYFSTNCIDIDIYHNSISVDFGTTGRALYITTGGAGNDVRNNSFAHFTATTTQAVYIVDTLNVSQFDYNNLYAPNSPNTLYLDGTNYNATNMIGAMGFNTNSVSGDPFYLNNSTDLHSLGATLFNAGSPSVPVFVDFDNTPRPQQGLPEIGADEFLVDSLNVSVISLLSPISFVCPDSAHAVQVVILNQGQNPVSNVPITVNYSGAVSGSLTNTVGLNIPFGGYDTVTVGFVNTWPGGQINFQVISGLLGDQNLGNDTLYASVTLSTSPSNPVGQDQDVCMNDSVTMSVVPTNGVHFWYNASSGGSQLAMGDTLNTGPLASTTTYWVEGRGLANGNLATNFAGTNGCQGNMFDLTAFNEVTLDSFDINIGATTSEVTEVYYKVGSYVGFETNPAAWTLLGSTTVIGAGAGQPTHLPIGGLTVPAGQTYGIYIKITSTNIDYNNGSTVYSNTDISLAMGVGLCSPFDGTNPSREWNGRIYYRSLGCPTTRVPLTANVFAYPAANLVNASACTAIVLDAGAGSGYTYNWSTGDTTQTITATTGGLYVATVTNHGCATTDSMTFTLTAPPVVNLGQPLVLCNGNTGLLDAGNPGATYAWSNGPSTQTITVSSAGTYAVTVTQNGCSGSDTISVTTGVSPTALYNFSVGGAGLSYSFTDLSTGSPTQWTWDFGDGSPADNSQNPTHTYAVSGTYTVTLTVTNACGTQTLQQTLTVVGIATALQVGNVQLQPNPSQGMTTLVFAADAAGNAEISLSDLHGKRVLVQQHSLQSGENRVQVDLSALSQGVYLVTVRADARVWTGKAVRE